MPRPYAFGFTRYASALAPRATFATQAGAAAATTGAAAILNGYLSSTNCNELVIDGWFPLEVPLKLPSHTKLRMLPGSGLYCMNGLNGPAIRNQNWVSSCVGGTLNGDGSRTGFTTDYLGNHNVDSNIAILGEGATIVGNRGNGTVGCCTSGDPRFSGTNSGGTPAGMYIAPIMLFGVNGLKIEGVTVQDPPSFGFQLANVFGVRCRDLAAFDPITLAGGTPGFTRNTSTLQCEGPIDDMVLNGFVCSGDDDSVALNAGDGNLWTSSPTAGNGPVVFGGWSTVYGGPITRVDVSNVRTTNSLNGVRLLCGPFLIDHVTFRGWKGTLYGGTMVAMPFGGVPGGGSIGTVRFEDWQAVQTGLIQYAYTLAIGYPTSHFSWQGRSVLAAGRYTPSLTVSSTVTEIDIRQDVIETGATVQAPWLHIATGGSVATATVGGTRNRTGQAASTTPLVLVDSGTTLNHLKLDGLADLNGGGLLSNAGAMTSVRAAVCLQSGTTATGIATTGTLTTLSGTGNNGVTTSGTITSSTNFASA